MFSPSGDRGDTQVCKSLILRGHSTVMNLKLYRYSGDDGFSNSGVDLEVLVRPRSKVLMIPLMMAISYMSVVFFQVLVVSHVTVTLVMLFHGTLLVTW